MQRRVFVHTPDAGRPVCVQRTGRLTLDDQARDALRAAYAAIMSWPKRKTADSVSHPDREQESVTRTYDAEITEMVS